MMAPVTLAIFPASKKEIDHTEKKICTPLGQNKEDREAEIFSDNSLIWLCSL